MSCCFPMGLMILLPSSFGQVTTSDCAASAVLFQAATAKMTQTLMSVQTWLSPKKTTISVK